MALCETMRFFGITSLIIVTIHAQVASYYPLVMMRSYCFTQGIYYALCAAALYFACPGGLFMTKAHIYGLLVVSAVFFFRGRTATGVHKAPTSAKKTKSKKEA